MDNRPRADVGSGSSVCLISVKGVNAHMVVTRGRERDVPPGGREWSGFFMEVQPAE